MSVSESGDERFVTPRAVAPTGGYASSDTEDVYGTPRAVAVGAGFVSSRSTGLSARSGASETEYGTPREMGYSSGHSSAADDSRRRSREEFYSSREEMSVPGTALPVVTMPFVASEGAVSLSHSSAAVGPGLPGYSISLPSASTRPLRHPRVASAAAAAALPRPSGTVATPPGGGGVGTSGGLTESDVADVFSLSRHGRVAELTEMLDRGIPVNVSDVHGNSILSVACQNGLKRVAKLALRRGADINCRNSKGNTPLHFCYAYGFGSTLGEYLISKGADPSLRNSAGYTCYEGLDGTGVPRGK